MEPDTALLESVRRMEGDALAIVFDEYAPALFHYAMRSCNDPLMADQIVGDVFAKLLDQLSCGHGPRLNLRSYLFESAYHLLVDQTRYWQRRSPLEEVEKRGEEGNEGRRWEKKRGEERGEKARQTQVTDYQRQVILLRFVEGFSLRETARLLGKSVNIVKAVQNRAMATLRKCLHPWVMA